MSASADSHNHLSPRPALMQQLRAISDGCVNCGLCRKDCAFLQRHGTPKEIADGYLPAGGANGRLPFECSLCRLCAAVCPVQLDPSAMFLEMRREAEARGCRHYGDSCRYLGYERRGTSRHLSYYALPADCRTVLFPGCTLPGTRPALTLALFRQLRQTIPDLGIVLDCCTKPSHDLGRTAYFSAMFGEMRAFLFARGVTEVLVNCPNCYKIFKRYGQPLKVRTVYEHLAADGLPVRQVPGAAYTVHDPCVLRHEPGIHAAVRELLQAGAATLEEMPHHGAHSLCCGEGGSVGCVSPELAENWRRLRTAEARGRNVVTYCAGCTHYLGAVTPTVHLLELLMGKRGGGRAKRLQASWFPLTCFNRLGLKQCLKREVEAHVVRERPGAPGDCAAGARFNKNTLAFWISLALSKLFFR